jgi:hypothetical protein
MGGGVQLDSFGTAATNRLIVQAPGGYDVGEIGGKIGRDNRSTWRNPAPVPLCPTQTPHAARTRTRAATAGCQRLTAWATEWPCLTLVSVLDNMTSNSRVIHKWIYWKLFGTKRWKSNRGAYSRIYMEGLKIITKGLKTAGNRVQSTVGMVTRYVITIKVWKLSTRKLLLRYSCW